MEQQLLPLLRSAGGGCRDSLAQLSSAAGNPDFFSALSRIFSNPIGDAYDRQVAASFLKMHLRNPVCSGNHDVQQAIMAGLGDGADVIRRAAAAFMADAVRIGAWPIDVATMVAGRVVDPAVADGAARVLCLVLEDGIATLDGDPRLQVIADAVVPLVISPQRQIQRNAFLAAGFLLEQATLNAQGQCYAAMRRMVRSVVQAAFLVNANDTMVATAATQTMVLSLVFYDVLDDTFNDMAERMLFLGNTAPEEKVRTEAMGFWCEALRYPSFAIRIQPALPTLIPMVISCLVYSEIEVNMLQANENDGHIPDRPDDIKPRVYTGRSRGLREDEAVDDEEVEEYNLRRVSAVTLDSMAHHFGDSIIDIVLNSVHSMLHPSRPWKDIEAAVLAIGAITEGCFSGLHSYMDSIVERLLMMLEAQDTHFLVRQICCWTLRQFSLHLLDGRSIFLERYVNCMLWCMQSSSKIVQEAATANFGEVVREATEGQFQPYLPAIVNTIARCFEAYQLKNRMALFDALEGMCRSCGATLGGDGVLEPLFGVLGRIWTETPNDSPMVFPLFACMSAVCTAVGIQMQPMAEGIFDRVATAIEFHVGCRAQGATDIEPQYLITALDLLSGLFDALRSSLQPLFQKWNPALMHHIQTAARDTDPVVRQGACAVLADVARWIPTYVQERLESIVACLRDNLMEISEASAGCVSNAAWASAQLMTGVFTMDQAQGEVLSDAHVSALFAALLQVLHFHLTADMRNMAENVCLAIGRTLNVDPDVMRRNGVHPTAFSRPFCEYVRNVKQSQEKEEAVMGFLSATVSDVSTVLQHPHACFDLVLSCRQNSNLKNICRRCLENIRQAAGPQWAGILGSYPKDAARQLYIEFSLK